MAHDARTVLLIKKGVADMLSRDRTPRDPPHEVMSVNNPVENNTTWSTSFIRYDGVIPGVEGEICVAEVTLEVRALVERPVDSLFMISYQCYASR